MQQVSLAGENEAHPNSESRGQESNPERDLASQDSMSEKQADNVLEDDDSEPSTWELLNPEKLVMADQARSTDISEMPQVYLLAKQALVAKMPQVYFLAKQALAANVNPEFPDLVEQFVKKFKGSGEGGADVEESKKTDALQAESAPDC